MPWAVTPISRRVPSSVQIAEPWSVYISWVSMPGDRGRLVLGVARLDGHLGAAGALAFTHELRNVLGQRLGLEGGLAEHDLADRVVDHLLEARHVRALLFGPEIDDAFKARGEQLLDVVVTNPDHLLDAGDADAGQADLHARQLRLYVDRRKRMCSLKCHCPPKG